MFAESRIAINSTRLAGQTAQVPKTLSLEEREAQGLPLGVWIIGSKLRVHTPRRIVSRMNFYR